MLADEPQKYQISGCVVISNTGYMYDISLHSWISDAVFLGKNINCFS